MPIGTGLAIGLGAMAAAGSVGGAAIGAHAAGNAAAAQVSAADTAAEVQQSDAAAALQQNEQASNIALQNSAPYRAAGQNAELAVNDLMGLTPINPYPINAGGNTAPTPALLNGTPATPGQINNPAAPAGPYPGAPVAPGTHREKGGPVSPVNRLATHYIVGEKGPEELTMFANGTGWVTPNKLLTDKPGMNRLIPRAFGGPVGADTSDFQARPNIHPVANPGTSAPIDFNLNPGGGPARPGAGATVATPNPAPGNPLIDGGSTTPSQLNPFTSWTQQFVPPSLQQAEDTPGYKFQLQAGDQAIQNQASATGELLDPNTQMALSKYNQNLAQTDYNNVYNQAMQQYDQRYNIFENNQTNQFNRLASIAGLGQTSTAQLNAGLQSGANTNSTALLNSGAQVGQQANNAGAATASGYVGGANAWSGAAGNIGNAITMPLYMQYLQSQGGAPTAESWMPQNPMPGQPYYPPGTP